jgi:hypothetical protein
VGQQVSADTFDYRSPGELFFSKAQGIHKYRPGVNYRRFSTAAEAIRFAIEDIPPPLLAGCYMEVEGERYEANQMRELYQSAEYPLPRLEKQDE